VEYAVEKMSLIADRQRAELALREAHDHLEQQVQVRTAELTRAGRMKDEFLATLSHELRTPLNAILGWITLVRDGRLGPERRENALESIERNARAQAKLIEDLLDVSRIISGKFILEPGAVDLKRVIEAACEVVRPAADAKQIRLVFMAAPEIQPVFADATRLQQAVWNLVSNAVKFTPANGVVEVRLRTNRDHALISVTDNGVGIEPEFLPYVFDRFRQADGSSTRSHGGLGIGLAIVRHIVELHGGSVWAESGGKNTGTVFTIDIPMVRSESYVGREPKAL
jgi:signal transduction histidine kinase